MCYSDISDHRVFKTFWMQEMCRDYWRKRRRKTLCDEVETFRELTYLGHMVSVCGGCEAAVPARTRCRWVMSRELYKGQQ